MEKFGGVSVTFKTRNSKHHPSSKRGLGYPHSRIADKYGMRPRSIIRRLLQERPLREGSHKRVKSKLQPFSKYRKKLATSRERSHVREINKAFENLRNALPSAAGCRNDASAAAKMTTLRLALRYIAALTQLLQEDDDQRSNDDDKTSSCSDTSGDDPKTSSSGQEGGKPEPSSNNDQEDSPEDKYMLALAKIFQESDDTNDTGTSDGDKDDRAYPSDSDDLLSSRGDFSDLSDHDVEGQLDVLANLSHLSEGETESGVLS
ncbi:helix-loop-helix protein delilah-like [Homarus americanus]|uniref:helix-loop-helix protein delilah-like n=1 Tax=Homarus americanus TaxID=6706 RepID=UPI001C4442C9|nr:helix-loop-helix protein delilah-like [Homarus americanus]XP_042237233.1 helix-loop-helix protein delilah-like [Homarus americanus]